MEQALSAERIVEAWDRGRTLPPARRPLALLRAGDPSVPPDELAALSVGERDDRLLALRAATFGRMLPASSQCPECAAAIIYELDIEEIRAERQGALPLLRHDLRVDGYVVQFRPPNSMDLAAAEAEPDLERAHATLLSRCVVHATRDRDASRIDPANLPESVIQSLGEAVSRVDPLCEIPIDLNCGMCSKVWTDFLDIAEYLWAEVAALAERLMYDVGRLARTYGWSESEILRMGPARRQRYLDLSGIR